ncbi:hypothetical protein NKDENANG_02622 [Candidatus Entotheonellaceae bacterium PAL068K]
MSHDRVIRRVLIKVLRNTILSTSYLFEAIRLAKLDPII